MKKHIAHLTAAALLVGASATAFAQQAAGTAQEWKYKAKRLDREQVDALLAKPEKLLVIDLRRPDEQVKYGAFPVFLSIQNKELEKNLAYLPKDRIVLTVSNHAGRAGAAADLLTAKGYTVAGAIGSEDYEKAGGKAVAHITPPPPQQAAR
jgi:rhodanese-related sulfurtransferase